MKNPTWLPVLGVAAALSVAVGTPAIAASEPTQAMQAVLDEHAALGAKPLESLTPEQARKGPSPADAVKSLLKKQGKSTAPEAVAKVEDRNVPGAAGNVPIRIYTPAGEGPFPVVFYIHGGGWVIADLNVYDSSARAITNAAKAVVVSTHYRQAPEHKFPASHDDVIATYKWTLANAGALGGDARNVAVVGESAGGNMAANVSIAARDQKLQMPKYQILIYPVATTAMDTESYQDSADAKPLSKPGMAWFFKHTLASPAEASDPRLSLVDADLKGLPATTIITAEIDPLRSDGKLLADKLKAAGVKVDFKNYDKVTHEFFGMGAAVPEAKDAVAFAAKGLSAGFAKK